VTLLRISELAERSGVPNSTLRYYERIGLVEPLGRAGNGYRVYDQTSVARLEFIARAKRLGMSLSDVATLAEAWFAGDCRPVQDRLREFVSGRISELRGQIAEDCAFERQLERILSRLSEGGPPPERCGPDCGCDTDPFESGRNDAGSPSLVCSLGQDEAERRLLDWGRVLAMAAHAERAGSAVRFVFDPSAGVIGELARLCVAESACCPFFTFDFGVTAAAIVLTIEGPPGSEQLLAGLAGEGIGG
jgi:DNA-binding transcriptional MerR regulator